MSKEIKIPKNRIDQFQKLVKDTWNIDLSFEEAELQGTDFFRLMEIVRLKSV